MEILYLFHYYITRILAQNHLDHHRWQLLGSIINKSSIKISILKKVACYVIIDCKS